MELTAGNLEAGEAKSPELSFSGSGSGSGSDALQSFTSFGAEVLSTVGRGDIETWQPDHVQYWLSTIGLTHYYQILADNGWDVGSKLIKLEQSQLFEYSKIHFKNATNAPDETQIELDVGRIMRDIQNYQINEFVEEEHEGITVDDIAEFERRLTQYATKWERIEWIKEYVEDWDGRLPTTEILEEELDVPNHLASDLLSAFQQKEKEEEIDLNKLFEGFSISEHGVVWWSICLEKLVLRGQDSLWTILRYILRELSTKVCIRLLNHFKFELLRFSSIEVDRLCQSIVYGSLFPMCTAIRLSGYLNDAAERDLSRSAEFFRVANDYAKLGVHLLDEYTDSDHLAAILLEMTSDIEGLSAIELAVKYEVIAFVSDKRIERISSSLFRTWRFLHISNKDESFKLRPLTIAEFYDLFKKPAFFMTPLGQFCIETMLFGVYLAIFTYVTSEQISIYQPWSWVEIVFWVLNIGYMLYECFDIWSSGGFARYIADWTNKFDFLIVCEFAIMMAIRFYHVIGRVYPQCFALNHQSPDESIKAIPSYVFFADLGDIGEDALPEDLEELCDIYQFTYNGELWAPQGCVNPAGQVTAGPGGPLTGAIADRLMDRCVPSNCCQDSAFNFTFSLLWIFAVLFLWFRVFQIMTMSKNIGPFINMIINMLRNFSYFFVILLVFWIGVVMSLTFIAGDTVQYDGVWLSAITTWRALLGEWPAVDLQGTVSEARFNLVNILNVYWMLFAAIILLNLLIALMTKSFDDLHEKNAMQVQFLQIQRIYGLDRTICVMPPPLFLVVLVVFFIFRFVDLLTAILLQYPLPISLLMPAWLIREGRETNLVGTHEVEWQEENVNKQLKQRKFGGCCGRCRKAYFVVNEQNMQQFDWQCKFCRQRTIVDYSRVRDATVSNENNHDAVQRLGDQLGLEKDEVFNVRRLQPLLCQNCFRHREPISRVEMQMEFISYWVFQVFLKWWLLVLLFVLREIVALFQTSIHSQLSVSDNVSRSEIASQSLCKYSEEVINKMPKTKEIRDLFKDDEIIWYLMDKSRFELTPRMFRRIVDSEILKRAHDRDYEIHEFYHKICGHHSTLSPMPQGKQSRQAMRLRQRQKEFGLAAKLWFMYIMDTCKDKIHLSHTKLFPFSAKLIESHIESTLIERGKAVQQISTADIQEFLPMVYVTDPAEQQIVLSSIREFGTSSMSLWQRLVQFLRETRRLLAYVRRIENMIRDVEDAVKAHGQDAEIYLSQFHLVFEDIQDDGIATVIFRSIDQQRKSIPYWKVRYFFIALKQMRRNIDRELLEKSRYTQVDKAEFLSVVLKRVKAIDDDSDDDDEDDDDNLRSDTQAAKRMIAGIRTEALLIFDRTYQQNGLKITLTQIRDAIIIKLVPELRNYDISGYLQHKFERYVQQKQFKNTVLTVSLLEKILNVDDEKVDKDEIPQISNMDEVVRTLQQVYDFNEDANAPVLTVRDAYSLVSVAYAMNHRIRNEVKSRGHDLELTQELFCKTMERKIMSAPGDAGGEERQYDYSKPFDEWTEVARRSASVFQQVLDEEQNKVTLGQVRETLRDVYKDFRVLVKNMQKFKRKLDAKKKLDEMVDFDRFWQFLVREMRVTDDSVGDQMIEKKSSLLTIGDQHDDDDDGEEKDGLLKKRSKHSEKHMTSFKRANFLFDLMEDHNGLWLTMRQIHVFLVFCGKMFHSTGVDWTEYQKDTTKVTEKEFLQTVMANMAPLTMHVDASEAEMKLATYVHTTQATEDMDGLPSLHHQVDPLSNSELERMLKIWNGEEQQYFEKQLKWIFSRCADGAETATWQSLYRFSQRFRDGYIEQRVLHDLTYLSGNHEVYRDEFEQFKSVLHCRGDVAISLFYEIRHFAESINWNQMLEFVHFLETNIRACREAIDEEVFGEDFDPTLEEMIAAMNISSEVDGQWLFDTVLKRHSDKVSWIEIREYLIDWNETRDEVTDYFEELIQYRDREKLTEKALEDITSKLGKIKTYFDGNFNVSKDELSRKNKEELIEFIVRSNWFNAAKQGFNTSQSQRPQQSPLSPQPSLTLDPKESKVMSLAKNIIGHKPRNSSKVISLV